MGDNLRLFIAVPIPQDLREKFAEIVSMLSATGADVKWVEEGNFHITLKFLGSTPLEKLELVKRTIEKSIAGAAKFEIKLENIGAFPSLRRPRVFWIGISAGHDELEKIACNLENSLEPLGFKKENRKFSAHLTIGRARSTDGLGYLIPQLEKNKDYKGGVVEVDNILLMQSKLSKKGPEYNVVQKFLLN